MPAPKKNWLEWSVFGMGLLLLLCTTGYLVYQAIFHRGEPASLTVHLGEPWSASTDPMHTTVPVTVRNDGGATATEVTVEVMVPGATASAPAERRELIFDFVPHQSSRTGALTFETNRGGGELRASVLGYIEP